MFTKETVKKVIERSNETELNATLVIGTGKLHISGGTDKIMDANFSFKGEGLEPIVDYEISENRKGQLTVSQCSSKFANMFNPKQDWQMTLNDQLPLLINLELGAGKSKLNLSSLNMKELNIEAGMGETEIDLTGNWLESFNVNIENGVGKTKIYLPKHIGVKLDVDKGVGKVHADYFIKVGSSYQNQAYENAKTKIDVKVDVGVGDVILEQKS
ncbi:toast rack family protein [Pseudalkalibacillus berkeleyi]|uniref:Toast rack family protein n=1 Tax=Pseudalkalibacillus berkeleyi TaxID=1069813 RepID=A0ABS9GTY7_9BACL|nr:toast rack family protein [Pseudalkalibacillus berkeleyi]MCF6136302.1 toast rack family protein [Pseudalkalibacillus berkeleyi]